LFSARVANLGKACTELGDVCEGWQPLSLLAERFYCLAYAKAKSCQRTFACPILVPGAGHAI
jgi:hypothetical protein